MTQKFSFGIAALSLLVFISIVSPENASSAGLTCENVLSSQEQASAISFPIEFYATNCHGQWAKKLYCKVDTQKNRVYNCLTATEYNASTSILPNSLPNLQAEQEAEVSSLDPGCMHTFDLLSQVDSTSVQSCIDYKKSSERTLDRILTPLYGQIYKFTKSWFTLGGLEAFASLFWLFCFFILIEVVIFFSPKSKIQKLLAGGATILFIISLHNTLGNITLEEPFVYEMKNGYFHYYELYKGAAHLSTFFLAHVIFFVAFTWWLRKRKAVTEIT